MATMMRVLRWVGFGAVGVAVALIVSYYAARAIWAETDPQPELATGRRDVPEVRTSTTMAVAAHPLATDAGHEILREGGAAIDAAVAMQAVLTLVEPQSSGIGGGAFLLLYDAKTRALLAYDGRETAPAAASPSLFQHQNGEPLGFIEAVVGGRSVGAPGALRMLEMAHRAHGRLSWRRLFERAIRLCIDGFEVTPRLHRLSRLDPVLRTQPVARQYFYQDDGRAWPVGYRLKNAPLAEVLRKIADHGADAFYEGEIAEAIVATVQEAERPAGYVVDLNWALIREMGAPYGSGFMASVDNPGLLSLEDLKSYRPKRRKAVCVDYRAWRLCGFGPPTSGGITTLQIIKMLEGFDIPAMSPRSPEFAHLFAESAKLAFADRARYIADPDFIDVPVAALLDAEYLKARAELIKVDRAMGRAAPGELPGVKTAFAEGVDRSLPSTSHMVVVDADRSVLSMTTSIENGFGSRLMVEGFLLNNQLTDFSFVPERAGRPVANAVAPDKRPRSSMSPLIVFDRQTEAPVLAIGSPGGSRIILYVARATLAVLDAGLSPQAAVELPHVANLNRRVTELEDVGWRPGELEAVERKLASLGHDVRVTSLNSGLHAVQLTEDALIGGADPRREGLAAGD